MTYYRESKGFFIEKQAELFAHELYLNNKYYQNRNEDIDRLMNAFLNKGWFLSENERKRLLKKAVAVTEKEYDLILNVDIL